MTVIPIRPIMLKAPEAPLSTVLRDIGAAIVRSDHKEQQALQAQAFAAINCWRTGPDCWPFNPEDIGHRRQGRLDHTIRDVRDHCVYFRTTAGKGVGRRAAIVTQPYGYVTEAEAEAFAVSYGLECHIPPHPRASFWAPSNALFIVLAAPGAVVRWLPEQIDGIVEVRS